MPFVRVVSNQGLSLEAKKDLCMAVSQNIADGMSKPISSVIVEFEFNDGLFMGGTVDPAVMIVVQGIGGTVEQIAPLLTTTCNQKLHVSPDRVLINMTAMEANMWAKGGVTIEELRKKS